VEPQSRRLRVSDGAMADFTTSGFRGEWLERGSFE
jgi:hypothetical protein